MNRLPGFSVVIITIILTLPACSSFNYRVAENYYEQYAFSKAIPKYEKVLRRDFIPDAAARLAESYNNTGNSLKAEIWYKRLVNNPEVKIEYKLKLAEVLMENGKYDEARNWFQQYLLLNSTDKRVKRMIQACDSIHLFFQDTTMFDISLMGINSADGFDSNFSPAYYKNGIVFLSDRPAPGKVRERSNWTGKEYLDLFYTYPTSADIWHEPELLSGTINGRYDEGPAVFSHDYTSVYFTRNDYQGKEIEKNIKDVSVLKMYYGIFSGTQWLMSAPVPFNSPDYSVGHPALTADGKTLFFVSDMPWGYGGTDIYSVNFENGKWTEPLNLGNMVNSEGNEMFPFIAADSVLYYASDGHIGLGGLDILSTWWDGRKWTRPENLQYPVNSSKDDFGFIIDSTNASGFFSSNRIRNTDKIYKFQKNPPEFSYQLRVSDSKSRPVKTFALHTAAMNDKSQTPVTGINGIAEIKLSPGKDYNYIVKSSGYYAAKKFVSTMGKRKSEILKDSVVLTKIEMNKAIVWKTIQFNKKSDEITPKIALALDSLYTILEMNPELQIEIASHTDSRGSFPDNYNLSRKRSDEIALYLINKGIRAPRLISIGYGEGKLLNYCRDGVLCLEEDHQVNNRIEIKVVDILK